MATYSYTAVDREGQAREGTIDAVNEDVAISALQRRGLIVSSIGSTEQTSVWNIRIFERVKNRDIVVLSRQIATLFEAQVSALRAFRLLAAEAPTPLLQEKLSAVADDIQGGSAISDALSKHPKAFSNFYVNMVRAGEEAGKLDQTFQFLADYLDRNYELSQKARNALIYPAFVTATFIAVMTLMLTSVIPRLADILLETGQEIPLYTKVVLGLSSFMSDYILLLGLAVVIGVAALYRLSRTESGKLQLARAQLGTPYLGDLYRKLYLSRISDNLSTMLGSGIQMVRALEISATVVGNKIYANMLMDVSEKVKGGVPVSEALSAYEEMPGIIIAMIKIGEETGNVGKILETVSRFYRREVDNAVDTLVSLIEPFLIVMLAVGVAFLLASVLIPIYNVSAGF